MIIAVTGGRTYSNRQKVFDTLDAIHRLHPISLLLHGGATGADTLAKEWAQERGVESITVPANWKAHGRAAGPIRNGLILDRSPSILVAFPGGKGTQNMTQQAKSRGIRVHSVVDFMAQ